MMIGELASQSGVIVETIRFYERSGLLPPARRLDNGRRVYDQNDVRRLRLVRQCRELGFSTGDIAAFIAMLNEPEASCHDASLLALRQVETIDRKVTQLLALKQKLENVAKGCQGRTVARCDILEMLED